MTQLAVADRRTVARAGDRQGGTVAPVFAEGDTWSMVSDNELALIETNPAEPTTERILAAAQGRTKLVGPCRVRPGGALARHPPLQAP